MTKQEILSLGWKANATTDGYYLTVQEVNECSLEALLLPDGDQYEIQMKYSGKFAAPSDVVFLGNIPDLFCLKLIMKLTGIKDFPAEEVLSPLTVNYIALREKMDELVSKVEALPRYEPELHILNEFEGMNMGITNVGRWIKYEDIKHLL